MPNKPLAKLKEPKTLPAQPRKRARGRPLKNPPLVLCDFCRKQPACWQRPIRLQNGDLLVHCDAKVCDQAYLKLAYKVRVPFKQIGFLSESTRPSRHYTQSRPSHATRRAQSLAQEKK